MTDVQFALLELVDLDRDMNVNKFWRIYMTRLADDGYRVATHWGRRGTRGSSKIETFQSFAPADAFYRGKLQEKRLKGYEVINEGSSAPSKEMLNLLGLTGTVATPTDPLSTFQIAAHQAVSELTGPRELRSMQTVDQVREAFAKLEAAWSEAQGWMEVVNDLLLVKLEA